MSDPWSRPTDDGPATPPDRVVEIELDGPGGDTTETAGAPPQREPNWRKIVALSSVAGVVVGAVVAAVIATGGDDDTDDDPSRPGVDESGQESLITTPETLPPIVVDTTVAEPVISGRPDLPLELPTYPDATVPSDILDDFVLDAELIAAQPADRVEIDVTGEDGLGMTMAVIEYDRDNDRYRATLDRRGPVQRQIVDVTSGTIYLMNGVRSGEQWDVLAADNAAESAAEEFRNVLLSPIRPDTLPSASTNAETAVILESGRVARRFRVAMPAVAIPEWTSAGVEPAAPGASHVFEAYVDEDGRLALVQGTVVAGGNRQLIVYRFDHDADVTIELPDVEPTVVQPGRRITEES